MADISAWSPIDESNTTAPPNGWPEFMMPAMVNNSARAMMGAVRRWYDQVLDGSLVLPYVSATGGGMTGGLTVNSVAGISTIGGITASGLIQGGAISSLGPASISGTVTAGGLGSTGSLNVAGGATILGSVTTGFLQASSLSVPNVATVGALTCNNNIYAGGSVSAAVYLTHAVRATTDAQPYTAGLAELRRLNPVSFVDGGTTRYGLVASEAAEVVPEMVGQAEGVPSPPQTLETGLLHWVVINAVKELAARVEALEGAP
jgi:hypothetical protein